MITMSTPSCSGSTLREASSTSAVICGYWRMKSPSRLAREHLAELYRRGNPQQSRRRLLQLHDRLLGLGEIVHDLPAALVVGLPYFGQAQLAGSAIEQAHAQALLQQGDAPAHRGLLHAQALRGLGEAVVLHHAGEDQRIIKPHYCSPISNKESEV